MNRHTLTALCAGVACIAASKGCKVFGYGMLLSTSLSALAAPPDVMIVTPIEEAVFRPVNPKLPDGPAIAVLRGDPDTGPSDMLLRMPRGTSPLHTHSADYTLVVIEGKMRHYARAEDAATAPALGPGSYWFQPAGSAHGDECVSDVCLMFIQWSGRRDARLAQ
jgi:Domain of unknown function (DUF4437)